MFALSRKQLLAIEAVLDIALHTGVEAVHSRDITERRGIPRRYLEPVLQQLSRAGILIGVRGPRGGYRLARERRRISLGELVRIVQAGEGDAVDESVSAGITVVRDLIQELESDFLDRLDGISIEELCHRARDSEALGTSARGLDFSI
jgi:Rrf2 family protein